MSLRVELGFRDEGADLGVSLPHPEARIRSAGAGGWQTYTQTRSLVPELKLYSQAH